MKAILDLLFGRRVEIEGTPLFHPFTIADTLDDTNNKFEVVIKPEALDTSNLTESKEEHLYRPISFDEYIGQQEAKDRISDYIKGCQKFNEVFPHTFLAGSSGQGKTTLALILANMLGKKLVIATAGEIKSEQQMVDKIVECESGILFLDEAHRISTKIGTFLLPLIEDFKVGNKRIKPFTLIFATTHKGNISKNLEALIQRFSLQIQLKTYELVDLEKIIKQYHTKKYNEINIGDDIIKLIAKNCRRTPRIALSLLKEYVFTEEWMKVLKNNQIIKDGLTINDFKMLKYLADNKGASKNTLAKVLRVEPNTIEYEIEPYLMFLELITIGNKRQLSKKGEEFIKQYDGVI